MTNPVVVEVTRGAIVESRHRGAIAVVDAGGTLKCGVGDIDRPVFPRSAVKAIQALPLVESGAADAYGFGKAELALATASHNGEPRHVDLARAMLSAAGQGPSALECGPQRPQFGDGSVATVLHNNCSGKHAGFICVACHGGIAPADYVTAGHPVQEAVRQALADVTGARLTADNAATDGCSIPTYAIPVRQLAHGTARFATGQGLALARAAAARRILDAAMSEPFLVAGTDRYCTGVMTEFSHRVYVKTGAEGVYCGAIPDLGLGIALKCDDGATRAAEVMMSAVLDALLPMSDAERAGFAERLAVPVPTRRGTVVGVVRPAVDLAATLKGRRA